MARIRWYKYVNAFVDRHGKPRYYFRRRGYKNVRLPSLPGSTEFMEAYAAAITGAKPVEVGASRSKPGTINAAVAGYFSSVSFAALAERTKSDRRNILDRLRVEHGDKGVATLQKHHVERMVVARAGTPGAATNFLIALRALMTYAVGVGLRADDPTIGIRRLRSRSRSGFYAWTEEDIAAFERKHPIGTRARLALVLLLYTGQRRSDVLRMGRQHVRDGVLHVRQQKTSATLAVPVHPQLAAVLDATPAENMTFLVTRTGRPFHPAAFSNWFKAKCRDAGLPERASVHGLRKAAARRLAEAGCTAHEISAITGHASLREVERYTKAADQERMARGALRKLIERGGS
jgi:integrase